MSNKEKILIGILSIILIFVIVKVSSNKKKQDNINTNNNSVSETMNDYEKYIDVLGDGTKVNKSDKLKQEKNIDGLIFKNIQLTNKNKQTTLLADVINTTGKKSELMLVDVVILDDKGNELGKAGGIVSPINSKETAKFNANMTFDYANAYDFKVVKK